MSARAIPGVPPARWTVAALLLGLTLACGESGPSGPSGGLTVSLRLGNGQSAPAATMVPVSPSVLVLNAKQEPVAGVSLTFSITAGGGATSDTIVTTNASGVASTSWYLGPSAGAENRLRVSLSEGGTAASTVTFSATAELPVVGSAYFGRNDYMEYLPGDLPIIISAPHGGTLTPAEIPNRTGNVTTAHDTFTQELARSIRDAFFEMTGRRPHVIICRLRRTKIDANREIVEATLGNRQAERAWYEYHAFIAAAKRRVDEDHARGLYMDLHGHGHAISRLELGYLLSAADLMLPDNTLSQQPYVIKSSVRTLVGSSGTPLAQLLRGPLSLGTLFEGKGFSSVPSTSQPDPGQGNPYFPGGYNTDRHGSRGGGQISGFQLESHFDGVRDFADNRDKFARALVEVFDVYLFTHFGIDITP